MYIGFYFSLPNGAVSASRATKTSIRLLQDVYHVVATLDRLRVTHFFRIAGVFPGSKWCRVHVSNAGSGNFPFAQAPTATLASAKTVQPDNTAQAPLVCRARSAHIAMQAPYFSATPARHTTMPSPLERENAHGVRTEN